MRLDAATLLCREHARALVARLTEPENRRDLDVCAGLHQRATRAVRTWAREEDGAPALVSLLLDDHRSEAEAGEEPRLPRLDLCRHAVPKSIALLDAVRALTRGTRGLSVVAETGVLHARVCAEKLALAGDERGVRLYLYRALQLLGEG